VVRRRKLGVIGQDVRVASGTIRVETEQRLITERCLCALCSVITNVSMSQFI
jgi:hypothetical protein